MSANSIPLSEDEWKRISELIKQDYSLSVLLISHAMMRELGCMVRHHHYFDERKNRYWTQLYLDFFDEQKETFFRLRYL